MEQQQTPTKKKDINAIGSIIDDELLSAVSSIFIIITSSITSSSFSNDYVIIINHLGDTQIGIISNMNLFPQQECFPNTPKIALVSQLYSSVKNRSDVDKELVCLNL